MSTTASTTNSGSAARWGPLWGARAGDWARSEEQHLPAYEEAIQRVGLQPGQRVLDVGCGAGVFLRLAADRGAEPFGIDASEALIDLARRRVPEADLRVGDMQFLPYGDGRFDLVTGFTAFFFAQDLVAALREAGRVAVPGAPVVMQVWGRHERCDLEAVKRIMRPFLPPPPPEEQDRPALWQPGVLEAIATEAGLTPSEAFDFSFAYEYADSETLGRLLLAPAGLATLVGPEHEKTVQAQIVEAMAPYRRPRAPTAWTTSTATSWRPHPDGGVRVDGPSTRRGGRGPLQRTCVPARPVRRRQLPIQGPPVPRPARDSKRRTR